MEINNKIKKINKKISPLTTAISPCTILIMLIKTKNSSSNFLTAVGIALQRLRKSLLSNTLPPPIKSYLILY